MAAKKEIVSVEIPRIKLSTTTITLVGTSPLITQPFPMKAMRAIEDKQMGKAKTIKHEIRNPWHDFTEAIYWLSEPPKGEYTEKSVSKAVINGRFGFHVGGIKKSAIQAAYRRGLVKNL